MQLISDVKGAPQSSLANHSPDNFELKVNLKFLLGKKNLYHYDVQPISDVKDNHQDAISLARTSSDHYKVKVYFQTLFC